MHFHYRYFPLLILLLSISFTGRIDSKDTLKSTKPEKLSQAQENGIAKILYDSKTQKIDSIVKHFQQHYDFNGSILVSYKGSPIYSKAVGSKNFKKGEPLKKDHVFQIASLSKQFTAMAIMMLKEQGKIEFEDKVIDYFPKIPYSQMTIRDLLNHTSGLPNYMWLLEHKWKKEQAPYNDDVIDLLIEHKLPLYFASGRRFHYSNTGYVLLASIVEEVSGQRFDQYLDQVIFTPLDMENTFVHSTAIKKDHSNKLVGYRWSRWGYRKIEKNVNDGIVGDKGVYSTIKDLYKWDQALYNNKLLSADLKKEAFSRGTVSSGYPVSYGFGFRIKYENDQKLVYHHGKWNGFRTSIVRDIHDTNTVIALNHTNSRHKDRLVKKIRKVLDQPLKDTLTPKVVNLALSKGADHALNKINSKKEFNTLDIDFEKIGKITRQLGRANRWDKADQLVTIQRKANPEIMAFDKHSSKLAN